MIKTILKWTEAKDQKAMNVEDPHWFATAMLTGAIEGVIDALAIGGLIAGTTTIGSKIASKFTKKSEG